MTRGISCHGEPGRDGHQKQIGEPLRTKTERMAGSINLGACLKDFHP